MDIDTRIVPKGELNTRGGINFLDFAELANSWNTALPLADLDKDGSVNIYDLLIQAENWLWTD
jgi:hypothetical protein